jgi:hypothetical protein
LDDRAKVVNDSSGPIENDISDHLAFLESQSVPKSKPFDALNDCSEQALRGPAFTSLVELCANGSESDKHQKFRMEKILSAGLP